ncbi:efflux transporter outer membrane subunit [Vogesella indigofera]|uniref:efflux transporter outer membrane subunit n=1 Tax=Vogesella indigofera TaxID=45465 RepID=UPI0035B1D880
MPEKQQKSARKFACIGLLLAFTATLAGCASVPDLGPQPQLHTPATLQSSQSLAGTGNSWAGQQWWQRYRDTQLDKLMAEALANAPDLATAQARILKAEGYAQQAGASRLPGVDLNGSVMRQKQSYNNGTPRAAIPQGFNTSARVALDFSYELDFWGKNRASVAAATSELAAAQAEAAQTRLMLTSAIAAAYAELARLHADRDATAQAVEVRRRSEALLNERQRNGLETLGSGYQAESRRAGAEADLIAVDEAIALQRNKLAALTGAGPDRGQSIARPSVDLSQAQGLPSEVQAELIGRRPDLVAARLCAEAAAKRIDVAHAGFYPNVNLGAYLGVQSLGIDMLSKGGAGIAGIGPAISLPIFRGGQLEGGYRVARAEYDSAVASYNQTLAQALREVADAVTQQRMLDPQLQLRKASLQAAQLAYRVSLERYQGGLGNYLTVLNTEDSVINARRVLTDLQSQQFTQDVALIKALGGGYQSDRT